MTPQDRVAAAVAELAAALRDEVRAEIEARQSDPPALLDVAGAARVVGVSRTTLYGLLDRPGGIRSHRIGRRRLIARVELDAFANRR